LIIQTRKTFESQNAHKNLAHIIAARTYSATTTKRETKKKKKKNKNKQKEQKKQKKKRAGKRRGKKKHLRDCSQDIRMCKYDGESEAALGSRRRRRRRKKKNSPLLHKSIEWGQKPLGTENAAGKKKNRKKERKRENKHNCTSI